MDQRGCLAKRFEKPQAPARGRVPHARIAGRGGRRSARAWLRLGGSDALEIANLGGWLTTVVARVCLDMLRARKTRREELQGAHIPESIADAQAAPTPSRKACSPTPSASRYSLCSIPLTPAERLAFVLHDMFGMPFDEIAHSSAALCPQRSSSRAARGAAFRRAAVSVTELRRERELVEAFLAASRGGDFEALVAVLDPDAVVRAGAVAVRAGASWRNGRSSMRGARRVAGDASPDSRWSRTVGLVVAPHGRLTMVLTFQLARDKITAIEVINDPRSSAPRARRLRRGLATVGRVDES